VILGLGAACAAGPPCGSAGTPPRYPAAAIAQLTASCTSAMASGMGPRRAAALCSCVVQRVQTNVRFDDAIAVFVPTHGRGHPMPTPAIVRDLNACRGAGG